MIPMFVRRAVRPLLLLTLLLPVACRRQVVETRPTIPLVREILAQSDLRGENWPDLKNTIKDEVHRFIFEKIKRNPMILPIILDV